MCTPLLSTASKARDESDQYSDILQHFPCTKKSRLHANHVLLHQPQTSHHAIWPRAFTDGSKQSHLWSKSRSQPWLSQTSPPVLSSRSEHRLQPSLLLEWYHNLGFGDHDGTRTGRTGWTLTVIFTVLPCVGVATSILQPYRNQRH